MDLAQPKRSKVVFLMNCSRCLLVAMLLLGKVLPAVAGEPAPQSVVDLAHARLAGVGRDPVIVAAVNARNLIDQDMPEILAIDADWRNEVATTPFMQSLMDSDCARRLLRIRDSAPYFAEIFIMDQRGALVAMTDRTSDYWQGDEEKFTRSFNNGAGAVFVDEVEFDESTMAYLSHVSVPVRMGDAVIGVITFGINTDVIEGETNTHANAVTTAGK